MDLLQNINALLSENRIDEALETANKYVAGNPGDAIALYARGKVYWRMDNRAEAVKDYTRSAAIDPDGPASIALQQAQEILHFYNPDMLNP